MKNPYKVLGVSVDISDDELKKVYRNLCRKNHPDNGGDANTFAEINKAYDMIISGDAKKSLAPKRDTIIHNGLFKYGFKMV